MACRFQHVGVSNKEDLETLPARENRSGPIWSPNFEKTNNPPDLGNSMKFPEYARPPTQSSSIYIYLQHFGACDCENRAPISNIGTSMNFMSFLLCCGALSGGLRCHRHGCRDVGAGVAMSELAHPFSYRTGSVRWDWGGDVPGGFKY